MPAQPSQSERVGTWWVFVIPPGEHDWQPCGSVGRMTADEAIQVVIRRYDSPVWAFALEKGDHGSYYGLHYPEGVEPKVAPGPRIGPSGYVAETGS